MEMEELQTPEYRTQVKRWWVETGWTDGNGMGLWESTEKSVEVSSLKAAEELRDAWVAQGLLVTTRWGELRPLLLYGCFRIRCEWEDVEPSAEILRLRDEQAQILAANAALVAEAVAKEEARIVQIIDEYCGHDDIGQPYYIDLDGYDLDAMFAAIRARGEP